MLNINKRLSTEHQKEHSNDSAQVMKGETHMKAISIREPYASEILEGEKTIEYRSWTTKYRGDLLICATQSPRTKLSGKAVCIVNLHQITGDEFDGYEWHLKDVRPVEHFPVKGKLGFYEVELPAAGKK